MPRYIGRFAPSPTGALHAGSLVAALASWLDARAHGGQWLVRIEDVDKPRCVEGADQEILRQLAACGLHPDEAPVWQSKRHALYQAQLNQLIRQQRAYACTCSRKDIEAVWAVRGVLKTRHVELIYPGTCRSVAHSDSKLAWRLHTGSAPFFHPNQRLAGIESSQTAIDLGANQTSMISWQDRRLGSQEQNVEQEVGDFVLQRADGLWAYQLAVVVDDAAQGITHIVRGEDLADNTARQILLQCALGFLRPQYLHTPLVLAADGQKLSKQNGAAPLILDTPSNISSALNQAALQLGLHAAENSPPQALAAWQRQWAHRYGEPSAPLLPGRSHTATDAETQAGVGRQAA